MRKIESIQKNVFLNLKKNEIQNYKSIIGGKSDTSSKYGDRKGQTDWTIVTISRKDDSFGDTFVTFSETEAKLGYRYV